ncbi:unnamed protein product [Clonostachys rosea f. rosea IK726]|uniref:Uncharacterized protein n=1 Tax=Clonostachys rosea f. rosea IK726 TaxID=1349383 RepID=A0ACA9UGN6_BIOOC|nr:unnamed protein product [Clonostachys rosea f. rosea IK726]
MPRPSKLPRRARQRRNVGRNSVGDAAQSGANHGLHTKRQEEHHQTAQISNNAHDLGCKPDQYENNLGRDDSNLVRMLSIPTDDSSRQNSRKAKRGPTSSTDLSESDLESLVDSGYGSAEDDPENEARFYESFEAECEVEGPTMSVHKANTKKMTEPEEMRWNRYCIIRKRDPDESMKACNASFIKSYLHWRVKHSRIRKVSSILTYWNVLSMVYAVKTQRYMDGGMLYDIGNWIHAKLAPEFNLDYSKKEKSGLFVQDLDLILYHHWVHDKAVYDHEHLRASMSTILVLAGATATRPDALIGNVLYKHVEFQLFPPPAGQLRPRLGLVLNLEHLKGGEDHKIFGFYEEDDLIHDPVLHVMFHAFADGAFENELTCPEQIYDMTVPEYLDRIRLLWKEEWRERPLFRDVEGLQIASNKALKYRKVRGFLIRLGRELGYAKQLEFYDLRRGSGQKLNKALTPEERNKAMGHRLGDSGTYVRYYMPNFIGADVQSIIFGSTPQTDLIHLMGRLHRHQHAPKALTDQQKLEVTQDIRLTRYVEKRKRALERIKRAGYASAPAAKDTPDGKAYDRYRKKVETVRNVLLRKRMERAVQEFHETIHSKEVDQQLQGIKPTEVAQSDMKAEKSSTNCA